MSVCSTGNSDLWIIPMELCTPTYSGGIPVPAACLAASRWPNQKHKTEPTGPESLTPCVPDLGTVLSECVLVWPCIQVRILKISKARPELGFLMRLLSLSLGRPLLYTAQETFLRRPFSAGSRVPQLRRLLSGSRWGPRLGSRVWREQQKTQGILLIPSNDRW